jgi:hypothetical protein
VKGVTALGGQCPSFPLAARIPIRGVRRLPGRREDRTEKPAPEHLELGCARKEIGGRVTVRAENLSGLEAFAIPQILGTG